MSDLRPGWALVVGGSGGLGAAICEHLGGAGQDVVVGYGGNLEKAEAVAMRVRERGARAQVRSIGLDVGDVGSTEGLGALVWAVGPEIGQPYLSQTDPADLARVLEVEAMGFFRVARRCIPALRESGGSVVALVSAGLERWPPGDGLSVIPKAAVQATIRGIAREEARHGVRANAVGVGVIDAGMFHRIDFDEAWLEAARDNIPLRRFGTAEEVAATVGFLVSDGARYLTAQTIYVDGGYTA